MSSLNAAVTAIVAALQGAAPQVDRVRLRPLPSNCAQALVVRPTQSRVMDAELPTGHPIEITSLVQVECYARAPAGESPDVAVDPLITEVVQRLLVEPTLGGQALLVQLMGVEFDFDVDAQATACATVSFTVRHRTAGPTF